jgi:allantoinase
MGAWGGIAGLQFAMSVAWTEARRRGHDLVALARWTSSRPAALARLPHKGAIERGRDADLVVWDPDAAVTVTSSMVRHRYALTPYEGRVLHGVVASTYVRGVRVHDAADSTFTAPVLGRQLRAEA